MVSAGYVASVSTEFKRLFLRGIKWKSEEAALSLADALKKSAQGILKETSNGRVIVATAGNGRQVTFNVPTVGTFTPQIAAELNSELLDRYDAAKSAVITAGTEEPDDDQIMAEMLAMLQTVDEAYADFSEMVR